VSDHGGPGPGWYPDPEDAGTQRYWDGERWTGHAAPRTPGSPAAAAAAGSVRGGYAGTPAGAPANVRGLAVASMVLGIVAAVFTILCWPIGIVCALVGLPMGAVAFARINSGSAANDGKGQAIAGLVLSLVALSLTVIVWLALGLTMMAF
jgi:hypothetical protein